MNDASRPKAEDYQQALNSMGTMIDISVGDLMTLCQRAEQFARQRGLAANRIASLMSQPVITVNPGTSFSEAAHLLVSNRIGGLPVVDSKEKLVGIITESDFLEILGVPALSKGKGLWLTLENLFAHQGEMNAPEEPVSSHMSKPVITARAEDDVQTVLDLMKQHRVKRIIVVDDEQHVLGIVTRSNLVKLFFDSYLGRSRQEVRGKG